MNNILTVPDIRLYYPTLTVTKAPDPLVQDMLDNAMSHVTKTLDVDLSQGLSQPVTITFRWEDVPQRQLKFPVPADLSELLTVTEGVPPIPVPSSNLAVYPGYITRNPGWQSFYWFDRVSPLLPGFIPPIVVTYTPQDDVFRIVKDKMLELVRLRAALLGLFGKNPGQFAGQGIKEIQDEEQTVVYDQPLSTTAYNAAVAEILSSLRAYFRGPRIG